MPIIARQLAVSQLKRSIQFVFISFISAPIAQLSTMIKTIFSVVSLAAIATAQQPVVAPIGPPSGSSPTVVVPVTVLPPVQVSAPVPVFVPVTVTTPVSMPVVATPVSSGGKPPKTTKKAKSPSPKGSKLTAAKSSRRYLTALQ